MAKANPVLVRNEEEEQKQVRQDLTKVVVLNTLFFVILLVLFLVNRSSGKVDQFFAKLLKF